MCGISRAEKSKYSGTTKFAEQLFRSPKRKARLLNAAEPKRRCNNWRHDDHDHDRTVDERSVPLAGNQLLIYTQWDHYIDEEV